MSFAPPTPTPQREQPDVNAAVEQAFQNLDAKLEHLAPSPKPDPAQQAEQQAHAIIKTLGQELRTASQALYKVAETLKLQPNLAVPQRLQMANWTMAHSRRAREAAESVLG